MNHQQLVDSYMKAGGQQRESALASLASLSKPDNRLLIDSFKKAHSLQLDVDLTSIFGVSKQQLSDWMNDRRPIPALLKFRMLLLIGVPHTMEFAAFFVDRAELAQRVLQDRYAISALKAGDQS